MLTKQFRLRKYCKFTKKRWILFIIAALFILEECFGDGFCRLLFANMYSSEFTIPITAERVLNHSVGIVVLVDKAGSNQYSLARSTVQCYAKVHDYNLHYIDISTLSNLSTRCHQTDLMFRRHCFVSWLSEGWEDEWIFFLDADIGVINPNNLLESYIPSEKETNFIFYDRMFNHEIMAGSYLFRNCNSSREFLLFWSNYEFKLPKSFHGSDNGAIHSALFDFYSSADEQLHDICKNLWKASLNYNTLANYVVCMRTLLKKLPPRNVKVIQKGRKSWARDGWLTNSQWSSRDFLFHGWQLRRLDHRVFGEWHSPLVNDYWANNLCYNRSKAHLNWRYKDSFYKSNVYIDRILHSKIEAVSAEYKKIEAKISVGG